MSFPTYEEARRYAEQRVRETNQPHGLSRNAALPGYGPWVVSMLPSKANRYGWELFCEAIEPESESAR